MSEQENRTKEALQEVKTALDEMRLAGFDVIYGDRLPEWAHEATVAGFRRKLDNGRFDVKWLYNFVSYEGVTGWTTGDPMESMELDACLSVLSRWFQTGEWPDGSKED